MDDGRMTLETPRCFACDKYAFKIRRASQFAHAYGGIDGGHHKQWVIDQMLRALMGQDYESFVTHYNSREGYDPWDTGIAP